MSLIWRINLVLAIGFALCFAAAALLLDATFEAGARRDVLAEAGLMMDSAVAIRGYTANEIDPLLTERLKDEFLPQSVPFYAATQNFLMLHERHPQYSYREATLNPTNPRDRAEEWESDIIQRFRNDGTAQEFVGERDTPLGRSLYLARPIVAETECLSCHGVPAAGPRTVIARYGSANGFGWQPHEVIGAHIVSVPLSSAQARAHGSFVRSMAWLAALFLALLALTNLVLYALVLRPLRRTVLIADRLSIGDHTAPEFPGGSGEIGRLGAAFNRMRKSLQKALQLLEP
jgi:protein-histidine pros-kinase